MTVRKYLVGDVKVGGGLGHDDELLLVRVRPQQARQMVLYDAIIACGRQRRQRVAYLLDVYPCGARL